jgi:glycosyltransferase involved in cell wall biosynthesis
MSARRLISILMPVMRRVWEVDDSLYGRDGVIRRSRRGSWSPDPHWGVDYPPLDRNIELVLESYRAQTVATDHWEIVLVDVGLDAGEEGYRERLLERFSDLPMRCVERPGAGRSEAKNAALDASRGDLLLLTDGDVMLAPDFLERLWSARRPRTVWVGNCLDGPSFLSFSPDEIRTGHWTARYRHAVDWSRICLFCHDRWDAQRWDQRDQVAAEYHIEPLADDGLLGTLYRDRGEGHAWSAGFDDYNPWSNAYGRSVAVERRYLGRWDEGFEGWPGDDVDIASGWATQSLDFAYAVNLLALHLDHPHPRYYQQEASAEIVRRNERRMLANARRREERFGAAERS